MKTRISLAAIFAFGFVLATFTAAQDQKEARYKELPNFHPVNSNLYRGGQPEIGGLEQLKKLGVKTIINLRDDDERARAEKTKPSRWDSVTSTFLLQVSIDHRIKRWMKC